MIKEIEIPNNCPECNSKLQLINYQLFCNNMSCPARTLKRLQAFAKVMKIKGLGPKTIEKLCLEDICDIYNLDREFAEDAIGLKLTNKLLDNINNSKQVPFSRFLRSLSIPMIGETLSKRIAVVINSLDEITSDTLAEVQIGQKAKESLLSWINLYGSMYKALPIEFTITRTKSKGITVCITGKLNNFKNRSLAAEHLEKLGYTVVKSITKNLDYLVSEENKNSSKYEKAKRLNIKIVPIDYLEDK